MIHSRSLAGPLAKLLVFASVTLVLTALLAQALGSLSLGAGGTGYRARFSDVTGVLPGDDVRIAGVKVGQVTAVRLVDNSVAELSFTVDRQVPLATSVHATIRYRNLVGQRYLVLTEGAGGAPLHPNGLIPQSQTSPALDLTVLFNGFQPLFAALNPKDVNSLAYEIIQVLQGESGTVTGLLAHTASLTTALADRDQVINQVVTNLDTVLSTLDSRRDTLSDVILQLQQFVSGLAADRTAIGQAISNIGDLTAATASLLQDARPALNADIDQLGSLAGVLNRNSATIDSTLSRLPGQYQALTGTASDGSWFNFFMCDFDGQVALPGIGSVNPATFSSSAASCQGGGAG